MNKKYKPILIITLLLSFMILALLLRIVPILFIQDQGFIHHIDPDTWYTMRQIEVMVADFPQYNWFDPMTAYPQGKDIDWGLLYPMIAAILCLLSGATTRSDIIFIAGWVSPLMAAAMVPITYKIGKIIWDWKAGLVSAGFISVVSYVFFYQSTFGLLDHHTSEIFFTTLFFLTYIYTLKRTRETPVITKQWKTICVVVLLSGLSGLLYFLGYLASPTVLLAMLVIGIYTGIQFLVDFAANERSEYLVIVNTVLLTSIALLVTFFGFHNQGMSLTTYSSGHLFVLLGLIAETIFLYCLGRFFSKNHKHFFFSIGAIIIVGILLLQVIPALNTIQNQILSLFFGSSAYSLAVKETFGWTFSAAYGTFNAALFLMAGGIGILVWSAVKKQPNRQSIILLVWLSVTLLLSFSYQRFQVYLTIPLIITAALCSTEAIQWAWKGTGDHLFSRAFGDPGPKEQDGRSDNSGKKDPKRKKTSRLHKKKDAIIMIKYLTLVSVIILTVLTFGIAVEQDLRYVANTPDNEVSSDWVKTLDWIGSSTPSIQVGYFERYTKGTFEYPDNTYGILAPWEMGHRITFLAKRIPITNPFQDNLAGSRGVAAFYLSDDVVKADTILSSLGGRYIVTDLGTATDTFPSLIPWVTGSAELSPYLRVAYVEDVNNPSGLNQIHLLDNNYFQTMIVRLQIFDGSLALPDTAQYTEYRIRSVPDSGNTAGIGGLARVITGTQIVNVTTDTRKISPEGAVLTPGAGYAGIFSNAPYMPVKKVPALTHYRLVYESPTNISMKLFGSASGSTLPDIRLVKVFEYVRGARIFGEGIIEVPIITNTGRTFVYRQESAHGEFVVPYATGGTVYGVKTTGPYHIVGTNRYITVTEPDVVNGTTVTGVELWSRN